MILPLEKKRTFIFVSAFFLIYLLVNIPKVSASDFTFKLSITEALKNSLELKSEKYRLESVKHSLEETYSSKDWSNSFTTIYNSSSKQSDSVGSYINDDTTTSTISLSKKIFDGGEAFEKYAKDISKAQEKYQKAAEKIVEAKNSDKKIQQAEDKLANRISDADDKFTEDLNKVSKQLIKNESVSLVNSGWVSDKVYSKDFVNHGQRVSTYVEG